MRSQWILFSSSGSSTFSAVNSNFIYLKGMTQGSLGNSDLKIPGYTGISFPKRRTWAVLSPCPPGGSKPHICSWVPSSPTLCILSTSKPWRPPPLSNDLSETAPESRPLYKYKHLSLHKNKTMPTRSTPYGRPIPRPSVTQVFFLPPASCHVPLSLLPTYSFAGRLSLSSSPNTLHTSGKPNH